MSAGWLQPLFMGGGGPDLANLAGVDGISKDDIRQECVEMPVFVTRDPNSQGRFTFQGKRLTPPANFMSDNCNLSNNDCQYHPGAWVPGGLFGFFTWDHEPSESVDPHRNILPGVLRGEFWRVPNDQLLPGTGYTVKAGSMLGKCWRCVTRSTQTEDVSSTAPPGFEYGQFDPYQIPTDGGSELCDAPIVWKRDPATGLLQPVAHWRWERNKAPALETALGDLKSEVRLNTACDWIFLPTFEDPELPGEFGWDVYKDQFFNFNGSGNPDLPPGPRGTLQKIMSYMGTQAEMPLYLTRVTRNTPQSQNLEVDYMGCRYMTEDDLRAIEHPNVDTLFAGRELGETLDTPGIGLNPETGVQTSIDQVYYGCQLSIFKTVQPSPQGEPEDIEWSVSMLHRFDLRFRNTTPSGVSTPWNFTWQGRAPLLERQTNITPVLNLLTCYIKRSRTWVVGGPCSPADPAFGVATMPPGSGSRLESGFDDETTSFGNNGQEDSKQGICTLMYYPLNEKEW